MEDAAADEVKLGDSCYAKRVDTGSNNSTSFGMQAEPEALPCRDDVSVDKSAEAPMSCLSPVETCTLRAAGGLLPVGAASTAMRTTFP